MKHTPAQERLLERFGKALNIHSPNIYFFGDAEEPVFTLHGLLSLAYASPSVYSVQVEPLRYNLDLNIAFSGCEIKTDNGTLKNFSAAKLNERLKSGNTIEEAQEAFEIAATRALRNALMVMGLDPMQLLNDAEAESPDEFDRQLAALTVDAITGDRTDLEKEIREMANKLGYIKGPNELGFQETIHRFFPGKSFLNQLTEPEAMKLHDVFSLILNLKKAA
jgi:hypothetical protein